MFNMDCIISSINQPLSLKSSAKVILHLKQNPGCITPQLENYFCVSKLIPAKKKLLYLKQQQKFSFSHHNSKLTYSNMV